jgi:hypothetical protein
MSAATLHHPPSTNHPRLGHLASVRVTGVLTADAQLYPTAGRTPHALLMLQMQPAKGLPYEARLDLGTDVADHMLAQAELPWLRTGTLVSVAGDALELRTDHGHAVLRVVRPRDAVSFNHPITATADISLEG